MEKAGINLEKLNIGIVGLGWWGPKLLRNFQNHPSVNKIYGYDISNEAINKALNVGLNFEPTTSYDNLLDNKISSLVIATPPKTHFELAKSALDRGKNVLITKPPSETKTEIDMLARLVKKKGLTFMVDATYVFNPALVTVHSILHKNKINNLKSIRILRSGDELRREHINRLRNTMFTNNINIVQDLIFHDISILIYLFNNELEIEYIKKFNNIHNSISDSAIIILKIKTIPIIIEYSWIFPERRREYQFYYDDKLLIFDDVSPDEKIWKFSYEDKKKHSYNYEHSEPLYCEVDHFISCIKGRTEPKTGINFMKKVMTIMEKTEHYKEP